jgi:uncharacterized SAM-binding protein YcdF (DUF218 family)
MQRASRFLSRTLQILGLSVGLVYLTVTLTPLVRWWTEYMSGPLVEPKGEVMVVLGGEMEADGIMGYSTFTRCVYALYAWREGGFKTIVVSGGGPPGDTAVADAMARFLIAEGVPPEAIVRETKSQNTRENIVAVKQIVSRLPGRVVLLTSDCHMRRALAVCAKDNLAVEARPVPELLNLYKWHRERWRMFTTLVGETMAFYYYNLRGWL